MSALATALLLSAPLLSVEEYRRELGAIEEALRAGDRVVARDRARDLLASEVAFGEERLAPDPSLLGAAAAGDHPAPGLADRMAALRSALGETGAATPGAPDPARLDEVRRRQAQAAIQKGGDVRQPPLEALTIPEQVRRALAALGDWLADAWDRLAEWLRKLWPRRRPRGWDPSGFELNVAVLALVAVVVALLSVLALRALRRSRSAAGVTASVAEGSSARDEDPLSRETGEWERYAAELAAAGRRREAVRAWYHAVLVALFRSGILHYQKGRTNWEYVSRIGPDAAWRPSFLAMTRLFDREWYGRDASAPESLRSCAGEARRILGALRSEARA